MAVYKRDYRRYEGRLTETRWRALIIPRYFYGRMFQSKLFTAYFVICLLPSFVAGLIIYLHHNISAIKALSIPADGLIPIDERFFLGLLAIHSSMGFILTAIVGPGLISPDLSHNALPLYFSRPFTRRQYVVGKLIVLAALLSLVTWIPDLLLFTLQSSLAGWDWLKANYWLAFAIFASSWIWILTVSLMALAISAWVRWKPVAAAALFGVFFAAAAFGEAINNILFTRMGHLLNLGEMMRVTWFRLFSIEDTVRIYGFGPIAPWNAFLSLAVVCVVSLWLLSRKIRAYEVVR